jgi:hypothetical protein
MIYDFLSTESRNMPDGKWDMCTETKERGQVEIYEVLAIHTFLERNLGKNGTKFKHQGFSYINMFKGVYQMIQN